MLIHRHMVIYTNNLVIFGVLNYTHSMMENIVVTEKMHRCAFCEW